MQTTNVKNWCQVCKTRDYLAAKYLSLEFPSFPQNRAAQKHLGNIYFKL